MNDTDKIVKSINECRKMKIEILPPDINLSGREFKVIGNSIRFGLEAVKGVGGAAIESIIEVRREGGPFSDVPDFIGRVDTRKVNKKVLESLVKAGAFDSFGVTRAAAMKTVADSLNGSARKDTGQQSFFGEEAAAEAAGVEEWEEGEVLRNEKEALGFYITGHPLTRYDATLRRLKAKKTSDIEDAADRQEVAVGGVLRVIKKKNVKSTGDPMAYLTLEDDEGSVEAIVFPELYKSVGGLLKKDGLVLVKGTIDRDEKGVRVRAREVSVLDDAGRGGASRIEISLKDGGSGSERLKMIQSLVAQYPGDCRLFLRIRLNGSQTLIATAMQLNPEASLISSLEDIAGKGAVALS
jgi:DNA polymerase-3 subunit alpha